MIEPNNIYLGDCLELMREIPDGSIDMILCDPPYGTTACKWDAVIPFKFLWEQYERIIKDNGAIVLFSSQPFTSLLINSNLKLFKYEWIWHKNTGSGFVTAKYKPLKYHENIIVFCKNKTKYNPIPTERFSESSKKVCKKPVSGGGNSSHRSNVIQKVKVQYSCDTKNPESVLDFRSVPNGGGRKLHPTQKPVDLLEYLIKTYTNEGDLVLDNCFGSGSTLIAAKNLNRQFIGMEKEEKYFEIAKRRLE